MRKAFVAGIVAALSLGWASAASAVTYLIKYTGTITSTEENYGNTFMNGDQTGARIEVVYAYHTEAASTQSTADFFRYYSEAPDPPAVGSNIYFLGKVTFGASGNTFSEIRQDLNTGELSSAAIRDGWTLTASFDPLSAASDLLSAFSSAGTGTGFFDYGSTGTALRVRFDLDSVSISPAYQAPIPEPATWALMISGFAMTGVALRQRRTAAIPV